MTFKRFLTMTAVLAVGFSSFLCVTTSPVQAKGFFESLFGGGEDAAKGPPPEVTLQAPFPTNPVSAAPSAASGALMQMYDANHAKEQTSISLNQPHRSSAQIAEWASGMVSQAMSIAPATWDADFAKISSNFLPYAQQEYKAYVQSVNLITILNQHQMHLQAIANGPGIVTKEGAIGETYHWLVQVPIMSSFYSTTMQEVDKNANFQSQNLLVDVQVGRIQPKNAADIGLVIERWRVSGGR